MLDNKTITFDKFVRGMLTAFLIAGILYMVNLLGSVLLPFFIAWFLAYLIYPIVTFVHRRLHIRKRVPAIAVTLVFICSVAALIAYLIIPPMIEQFERFGYLVTRYLKEITHVQNVPEAIQAWVSRNEGSIKQFFETKEFSEAVKQLTPRLFEVVTTTANVLISITASLITLLYLFFILLDYEKLTAGFIKIFPPKNRPFWKALAADVERELNSYVRGQGLVALCIGILFCIGFTLIGFPMAIGMGLLIGLMSLIPYVHGLALIPMVFLSLLKAADTGQNFWAILAGAVGVFIVVQLLTDLVLTPRIMGKAMNLNPAVLLLSLSVWGTLLGFVGLIIALPLTTIIIAYYQRYITKDKLPHDITEETAVGETAENK